MTLRWGNRCYKIYTKTYLIFLLITCSTFLFIANNLDDIKITDIRRKSNQPIALGDENVASQPPSDNVERFQSFGLRGNDVSRAWAKDEISKVKVIVRWTKFYGEDWGVPEGREIFDQMRCPEKRCIITDDREMARAGDAILVHIRDAKHPDQLPSIRSPQQRWIFFSLESPYHSEANLTLFNGIFNWTSTYSSESDIPSPYGEYVSHKLISPASHGDLVKETDTSDHISITNYGVLSHNKSSIYSKMTQDSITRHPRHVPPHMLRLFKQKTRYGAWFATNCKSRNRREEYAQGLEKHIKLDIYGQCGRFICENRSLCLGMLRDRYKFYLAFENSNCKEYITEKLWDNALQHSVVPVVMGAWKADYEKLAPPHSFIHVSDYANPKHLARHLQAVTRDPELFSSYFNWRKYVKAFAHVRIKPDRAKLWCDLCQKLHTDNAPKTHWHLDTWWSIRNQCM